MGDFIEEIVSLEKIGKKELEYFMRYGDRKNKNKVGDRYTTASLVGEFFKMRLEFVISPDISLEEDDGNNVEYKSDDIGDNNDNETHLAQISTVTVYHSRHDEDKPCNNLG